MAIMKALSVKQPYASLISDGEKDVELRTWTTDYRGPILICSSSKGIMHKPREKELRAQFERTWPDGVALCVVELADIIPWPSRKHDPKAATALARRIGEEAVCDMCGEGFDARAFDYEGYAWILKDPRPLDAPFPVKGKLHLFDVEIP